MSISVLIFWFSSTNLRTVWVSDVSFIMVDVLYEKKVASWSWPPPDIQNVGVFPQPSRIWFLWNNLRTIWAFELIFLVGGWSLWEEGAFRWGPLLDMESSHLDFCQVTWEPFRFWTEFFWWLLYERKVPFGNGRCQTPRWQLWQLSWIWFLPSNLRTDIFIHSTDRSGTYA